ncbi:MULTISPECIES: amidase domain-containing protein [Cryobacterium]|uniref:CHAP domain-containing protein n=2 Tax=Cryobacterium TaxID=69578 RepID=A0ABY2IIG9_9MICO|nr:MULTISPECIES: amidase domain-containing protein [Cryobacterium]MEB0203091.1 amidase domain-containing protein [Cryobacterium sp. 5I3]TFC17267.1 CHAP domain-containing protein [Cryobacterium glucosi]
MRPHTRPEGPARSRHRREDPLPLRPISPPRPTDSPSSDSLSTGSLATAARSSDSLGVVRSRHRLEKAPSGHRPLIWLAGSAAAASLCFGLFVPLSSQASPGVATAASAPLAASRPVPASVVAAVPVVAGSPVIYSAVSAGDGGSAGPVTGGTVVSVTGSGLAGVSGVSFGGNAGTVLSATDTTVTISTPASTDYGTGSVAVSLVDSTGAIVPVASTPADAANAAAAAATAAAASKASSVASLSQAITPLVDAAAPLAAATPTPAPSGAASALASTGAAADTAPAVAVAAGVSPLTFQYVPDPRITAQIGYVRAHWNSYNSAVYGAIGGNDCVNFTSQSLIARGWTMDAEWSYSAAGAGYSSAWSSSTAFAAYLSAHPERATPLTAGESSRVKVGDIVQFDWDRSGDKDHTGIVTRVVKDASGTHLYYAGHTEDSLDKSVEESLANTGGTVSYWSVA